MQDPIHIVFASDDQYAQHMGVAALSVIRTTSMPARLRFHFLDAGISAENRERLQSIVRDSGAYCEFIKPDVTPFAELPAKRYGLAAFFRITIGKIIPSVVDKIIYLDCDVLAFDDIAALWNVKLQEQPVAAVTNLGHQPVSRLGIVDGGYFNSGVLVMDLDRWRKEELDARVLDFMHTKRTELLFPDQDGLNVVLNGRWSRLPLRWNQQPATYSMLRKKEEAPLVARAEFEDAIHRPGIVHYLGRNKPWHYMTFHPLKETYWYYLAQTPWRDYCYPDATLGNRIKKGLMLEKHLKRWKRKRETPVGYRCGV